VGQSKFVSRANLIESDSLRVADEFVEADAFAEGCFLLHAVDAAVSLIQVIDVEEVPVLAIEANTDAGFRAEVFREEDKGFKMAVFSPREPGRGYSVWKLRKLPLME
jgi:hypothetical protein